MSYTISQVADLSGVSPAALRRFDREGIVVPERVGKSRHRCYRDSDIQRLQRALSLQRFGMSAAEIKRALDRRTDVRRDDTGQPPSDVVPLEDSAVKLLERMGRLCRERVAPRSRLPQLMVGEYIATVSDSPEPALESVEGLADRSRMEPQRSELARLGADFPEWLAAALHNYVDRRLTRVLQRPLD